MNLKTVFFGLIMGLSMTSTYVFGEVILTDVLYRAPEIHLKFENRGTEVYTGPLLFSLKVKNRGPVLVLEKNWTLKAGESGLKRLVIPLNWQQQAFPQRVEAILTAKSFKQSRLKKHLLIQQVVKGPQVFDPTRKVSNIVR